jgi:hypothetical protein
MSNQFLELIEDSIDCVPLMDTKNISKMIEDYCKYNIIEECDLNFIKIDIDSCIESLISYLYCEIHTINKDEHKYYMCESVHHSLILENNKMYKVFSDNERIEVFKLCENKEKFIFIEKINDTDRTYDSYEIKKIFKDRIQFQKYIKKELLTYKNLLCNKLVPYGFDDFRFMTIEYNTKILWDYYDDNYEEDTEEDRMLYCMDKGSELNNLINDISFLI